MFEGRRVSRSMFRKGAPADAYAAVKAELRRTGWRLGAALCTDKASCGNC